MEERYIRNIPALSAEEQALLLTKRALIAGCGGLGGCLSETLTRLGVGTLTAVDGDRFQPSNLNRQLGCTMAALGLNKALALKERAEAIRPGMSYQAEEAFLTQENALALLAGADVALDALDSPAARLLLADACAQAGVPLVHGAVQGWTAQAAVVPPGSGLLKRLYQSAKEKNAPPAEREQTCLAFAPALCAAIQAAEAVKLLCGRPSALTGKVLTVDLQTMEAHIFTL